MTFVDYVSQEATAAGKNAAAYIQNGSSKDAASVEIFPVDGVRYTVPEICPSDRDGRHFNRPLPCGRGIQELLDCDLL